MLPSNFIMKIVVTQCWQSFFMKHNRQGVMSASHLSSRDICSREVRHSSVECRSIASANFCIASGKFCGGRLIPLVSCRKHNNLKYQQHINNFFYNFNNFNKNSSNLLIKKTLFFSNNLSTMRLNIILNQIVQFFMLRIKNSRI